MDLDAAKKHHAALWLPHQIESCLECELIAEVERLKIIEKVRLGELEAEVANVVRLREALASSNEQGVIKLIGEVNKLEAENVQLKLDAIAAESVKYHPGGE